MAESLAHRWGQIIGDCFELFVKNILSSVALRHRVYLDYKKPRAARGGQGKVTWQDSFGNKHDLDFVLERGGTEEKLGIPIAFIESAWRRYTKHSKNKVQEIEAAVTPIAQMFSRHQPFCGAVLSGEFTRNALRQLEAKGFSVLHIPYESILSAFDEIGIDASSLDGQKGTTESQFRRKITKWGKLPKDQVIPRILAKIHELHHEEIAGFTQRLESAINRQVISVRLSILRGHTIECADIRSAIAYLIEEERHTPAMEGTGAIESYEVQVRFNTGARIDANFPGRNEALIFLRSFA